MTLGQLQRFTQRPNKASEPDEEYFHFHGYFLFDLNWCQRGHIKACRLGRLGSSPFWHSWSSVKRPCHDATKKLTLWTMWFSSDYWNLWVAWFDSSRDNSWEVPSILFVSNNKNLSGVEDHLQTK